MVKIQHLNPVLPGISARSAEPEGSKRLILSEPASSILEFGRFWLGGGDFEGFETEAFYGGEDIVGGFGPAEGLWVGVDGVEVGSDRGLQFRSRAVDAAADLLFGDVDEEALDLIDPRAVGVKWNMPSRPCAEPLSDRLGLVGGVVVHHEVDVEAARDIAFDLARQCAPVRASPCAVLRRPRRESHIFVDQDTRAG